MGELKMEELQRGFAEYCSAFKIKLTSRYRNKEDEDMLKQALCFWKGIRVFNDFLFDNLVDHDTEGSRDADYLREQLLKHNLNHENQFIALLAKIEQLPTYVFRRALWYYNVDFQSFEAFLRRLTKVQIQGFESTYHDYVEKRVPDCFKNGFKNRLRCLFSSRWTGQIFDGEKEIYAVKKTRYQTKGAIAYEFFGIDFGHATFRKESDVYAVRGNRAERFLSKDKVDDFVVNQEDGAYWWLYRNIRSNYLWNSQKDVQLKQAICPGFWITLIAWVYVIFLSPLLFTLGATNVVAHEGFTALSTMLLVLGCFTPLAALFWIGKKAFNSFSDFVVKNIDMGTDEEYDQIMGTIVFLGIVGGAIASAIAGIWYGIYIWFYESFFIASWLTVCIVCYLGFVWRWKSDLSEALPWKFRYIGPSTVLFILGKLIVENREILLSIIMSVVNFLQTNWLLLFVIVAYAAALILLSLYYSSVKDKNDGVWSGQVKAAIDFDEVESAFKKVAFLAFLLVGVLPAVAIYLNHNLLFANFWILLYAIVATAITVRLLVCTWWLSDLGNAKASSILVANLIPRRVSAEEATFLKQLSRNKWLSSQVDYVIKAQKVRDFVNVWFGFEEYPTKILSINEKSFARLNEYGIFFIQNSTKGEKRLQYVGFMLEGMPVSEAEKLLDMDRVKQRERKEALEALYNKTLGKIFSPIKTGGIAVGKFVIKLYKDTVYLWKSFNESCPYLRPVERLDELSN